MLTINPKKISTYYTYRDDIQYNYDVLLVETELSTSALNVEILPSSSSFSNRDEVLQFLRILSQEPIKESDCEDVPFQAVFKPILGRCFQGYLQRILEFKYKVIIKGLDSNEHKLKLISPNDGDRMEVLTFLLQFDDLLDPNRDTVRDTNNVSQKMHKLMRELNEPLYQKSIIHPLTIRMKEVLLELIDSSKLNYDKIKALNRGDVTVNSTSKSSNNGPTIIIDGPPDDAFDTLQHRRLQEKGTLIYKNITKKYPQWDEMEVQTFIFSEIDRCLNDRTDMSTLYVLEVLKTKFDKPEEDIILVEDDKPPSDYQINEDIVHAWFLENYEESPAPNMSVYKRELYKQFLTLFELHYSGDNYETNYQIFLDQIHNCLQRHHLKFPKVQTKGSTGINGKKRFAYLRKKGPIAEPSIPTFINHPSVAPSPWTDLASAVNKRIVPIIIDAAVSKSVKANSPASLDFTINSPFDDATKESYKNTQYGIDGDPNCRRIVIDGSNLARSHGKVAEVKRRNGNQEVFSIIGIKIAVEEFWKIGCRKVTVFLPPNRKGNKGLPRIPEKERGLQKHMEDLDIIKYTPGRKIQGRFIQSYDDRFILDLACLEEGIVVSNDQFRDLIGDSLVYAKCINERLLPFVFTEDYIMLCKDPPRAGRTLILDKFIRHF